MKEVTAGVLPVMEDTIDYLSSEGYFAFLSFAQSQGFHTLLLWSRWVGEIDRINIETELQLFP